MEISNFISSVVSSYGQLDGWCPNRWLSLGLRLLKRCLRGLVVQGMFCGLGLVGSGFEYNRRCCCNVLMRFVLVDIGSVLRGG
jgi:hypothetical protein